MKNNQELDNVLSTAGITAILAFFIGIARTVIHEKHSNVMTFIRGIIASMVVAVLVGWSISNIGLSMTIQMAIVGICSYLADDVLLGLLVIGSLFRENPGSFLSKLLDLLRGKSVSSQNGSKE